MKYALFFIVLTTFSALSAPRITVIFVIDQLSAHYLPKLNPYLKGGLGFLYRNGVRYSNAFYDHSTPGTAPGHAMLSTGTYASIHGIVNNRWFNEQGTEIAADGDDKAFVFSPTGLYTHGKSARNLLVDTLSDQLIIHSYPHAQNKSWALSLKSRSAIFMAGRLGKALWLDPATIRFTSSKAYFKELPLWVKKFNKKHVLKEFTWKPIYESKSPAYAFDLSLDLSQSSLSILPFNNAIKLGPKLFDATPYANEYLLDFARSCIKNNYTGKKNERFVLWLGLSSLDLIGHTYGPHSKATIDMIYQIDEQLKHFISFIYSVVDAKDALFIVTADHGVQPIPELLQRKGFDLARRYLQDDLITDINYLILKKYGIANIIQNYNEPQFYLDKKKLATLSTAKKEAVYFDIKKYLKNVPGIKNAWTVDELSNAFIPTYDFDKSLQNQVFKGRTGDIIYSVYPYTLINKHLKGTSHITQYAYDTNVPLIVYQKDHLGPKRIAKMVSITQVPITLAALFDVPRPSASKAELLPGFDI